MKHLGTAALETERLRLRRFTPGDAADMYENWANDPEVTKFLTWPPHADTGVSAGYIASVIAEYERPETYNWCIERKETGRAIGAISVVRRDDSVESMHVGYCIGRAWWRTGVTSEAFAEVLRFLFEEVGVLRVDSRHDPRNPHSGDVMRKCGLRYEGTLRQSDRNNQGICDACWYGLLRDEYFAMKK